MQQKKGKYIQQNKSIKYIHSLTNNHPYIWKIDLKSSFHFCLVCELFFSLSKKGFGFRCCRCSVFFYVQREKSQRKKHTVHTRLKWNERKETLGKKWLRSSERLYRFEHQKSYRIGSKCQNEVLISTFKRFDFETE